MALAVCPQLVHSDQCPRVTANPTRCPELGSRSRRVQLDRVWGIVRSITEHGGVIGNLVSGMAEEQTLVRTAKPRVIN
jgi:hypothetical protein